MASPIRQPGPATAALSLYDQTAQAAAEMLTKKYSTSFSLAARLFDDRVRSNIYNIYGLVRIADEIVDTYQGSDRLEQLNDLEAETYRALEQGFSSNIIVQAFQYTARPYGIDKTLIAPFFASMRADLQPATYTSESYKVYIHGSAEVVGLMCLKVFVDGEAYHALHRGASHLGAAFQKINFLRDIAEDYTVLGRFYFPDMQFETFDDTAKTLVIADIRTDLAIAQPAIMRLPASSRPAVLTAFDYFSQLLNKLEATPAAGIKRNRIRIANSSKLWLLARRTVNRRTMGRQTQGNAYE